MRCYAHRYKSYRLCLYLCACVCVCVLRYEVSEDVSTRQQIKFRATSMNHILLLMVMIIDDGDVAVAVVLILFTGLSFYKCGGSVNWVVLLTVRKEL